MTTTTLPASTREGPVQPRWTFPKVASVVGAVILAVIWLVPLLWALDTSLKPEPVIRRKRKVLDS